MLRRTLNAAGLRPFINARPHKDEIGGLDLDVGFVDKERPLSEVEGRSFEEVKEEGDQRTRKIMEVYGITEVFIHNYGGQLLVRVFVGQRTASATWTIGPIGDGNMWQ